MFWGFLVLIVLVPSLANHWYRLRVKQWEMSLKHSMIERGMSAEEIKTVLETSSRDAALLPWWGKSCCSQKPA